MKPQEARSARVFAYLIFFKNAKCTEKPNPHTPGYVYLCNASRKLDIIFYTNAVLATVSQAKDIPT